MNQKRIHMMLCAAAIMAGCRSMQPQRTRPDISVTLHRPTVGRMISDVSARDFPPQRSVRENPDGTFTAIQPTDEEIENWRREFTAPVDLIVKVTNTSAHGLRLFEEWNSWGYCNLKLVFWNGFHEYWVTKQPGVWYRNFPSFRTLAVGESVYIPVALVGHMWSGLDHVRTNSNHITTVRALYEQYQTPMLRRPGDVWRGSVSTEFYPAAELLPRFDFRHVTTNRAAEADDIEIDIEI